MTSRLRRDLPMRAARNWAAAPTSISTRSQTGPRTSGRTHRVLQGSYLEQSTDDESQDESDGEEQEQDEQDADSDDDGADSDESEEQYSPLKHTTKRPRAVNNSTPLGGRKRTRHQATAAISEDDEQVDEAYLSPSAETSPRKRRHVVSTPIRRRSSPRRTPQKKTPSKSSPHKSSPKTTALSSHKKKSSISKSENGLSANGHPLPENVRIPPWDTLPFYVLNRIFSHAAASGDAATAKWLAAASRTCRSFCEPALSALYASPPLLSMNMAHSLLYTLDQDPSTTVLNYRTKIKSLVIEVGTLVSRMYRGQYLDLVELVRLCPRLAHFDLVHHKDLPPYRQLNENVRWTYPEGLFEAMGLPKATADNAVEEEPEEEPGRLDNVQHEQQEGQEAVMQEHVLQTDRPRRRRQQRQQEQEQEQEHGAESLALGQPVRARLLSWSWNQRFIDAESLTPARMLEMHKSPAFEDVTKLTLVNFQRPSLNARNVDDPEVMAEDARQAQEIGGLLAALPNLKHLAIESSTSANEYLIPLLPTSLEHLELINCWDVTPDTLSEYLVTHGQALRHLTLHHNQSLSLSFLPVLGSACPHLKSLCMNLLYYSQHESYNDAGPLYASLLQPDEVPAWPASLETLELEHLRKCGPDAAEALFQSLVASAPSLPKLRRLVIKAQLDIPWRQRSAIRDRWENRLKAVFVRRITDPRRLRSLQQFYGATNGAKNGVKRKGEAKKNVAAPTTPTRRSTRISDTTGQATSSLNGRHGGDGGRKRISYREPDTDDDMDLSDEDDEAGDGGAHSDSESRPSSRGSAKVDEDLVAQGMCDLVDIRIDNQKPVEFQYSMDDFLDEEDDDDDDEWTGDIAENTDYAW